MDHNTNLLVNWFEPAPAGPVPHKMENTMRKNVAGVSQHTHYVTGVMSEDDSGLPADNSMMPEVGKADQSPAVPNIGARHGGKKAAPAPKAKASSKSE